MRGASVVARAWSDPVYKQELLANPTEVLNEDGYTGLNHIDIDIVENTPNYHNVMICTLCSCFPWPVFGLPPTWYKSPEYRLKMAKRPRKTLRSDPRIDIGGDGEIRSGTPRAKSGIWCFHNGLRARWTCPRKN